MIEWLVATLIAIGRIRGVLCQFLGHRIVTVRRITRDYRMEAVYQCSRCGEEPPD